MTTEFTWLKLKFGAPSNPKWRKVAVNVGCRQSEVWTTYSWALDYAGQHNGSLVGFDLDEVAATTDIAVDLIRKIWDCFIEAAIVVGDQLRHWIEHQGKKAVSAAVSIFNNKNRSSSSAVEWRKRTGITYPAWRQLRDQVLERDGHKCVSCSGVDRLHCAYIVEPANGGPTELGNLQTMCVRCHGRKNQKHRWPQSELDLTGPAAACTAASREASPGLSRPRARPHGPTEEERDKEPTTKADAFVGAATSAATPPKGDTKNCATSQHRGNHDLPRRTPIDPGWQPDDDAIDFAIGKGFGLDELREQAERFRNHHLAKGSSIADWRAAWHNWITSPFARTASSMPGGFGSKRYGWTDSSILAGTRAAFDDLARRRAMGGGHHISA